MSVTEVLTMILLGVWVFVPALLPNSAAVVFGGGTPVDFGKSMGGRRILGDGKTWRGFFGGAFSGIAIGLVMMGIAYLFHAEDFWGFGSDPVSAVGVIACLSFGSLIGDMLGSFIKRRLGIERGQKAPVLDQFDFVIGAFLITGIFYPHWLFATYLDGIHLVSLAVLLVLVLVLHRGVNIIGYKLGLKNEPW